MTLHERFAKILDLKDKYIHLEGSDASYYIERDGSTLNIYFEWSNGPKDWAHNFAFFAKPYKRMQHTWFVHGGFFKVFKAVQPYIDEVIYDFDITDINVSGYSHGAAIALLCYEYCKYYRPDITHRIRGYGYGCPRVIWGFVPKVIKKRFKGFLVIRNDSDMVTHVPPLVFGFRHVGTILSIGVGEEYNSIDAHRPESYLSELEVVS